MLRSALAILLAAAFPLAAGAQGPDAVATPLDIAVSQASGSHLFLSATRDGVPVPPDELRATLAQQVAQLFLDVPAAEAPTLDVGFAPAGDGGWTISLTRGGTSASDAQVRIAVDSEEPQIATGDTYHLPPLADGVHEIKVHLYTADGRAYLSGGSFVGRRLVVLQSGGNASLASPTLFEGSIVGGKLAAGNATLTTRQGTATELRFTSDAELELHLHGYDIEAEIWDSDPVSLLFNANIPGRFPMESHGGAGEAVILYLEVYP
jgi:hypothetical protein